MYYSLIKKVAIEDGPGVRVALFVSGCRNHCKGCFQPETWAFDYGQPFDEKALERLLEALRPSYVAGLTILGGDPMEPENQGCVLGICKAVKDKYPNKSVWLYTGYFYECFLGLRADNIFYELRSEILNYVDVMVDGPFIEEKKDLSLRFRGSSNQRIIDVKRSLENHCTCLWVDKDARNDMGRHK